MGILFMSEINYYLTPTMSEELFVDTSRGSKLRINLDVIVPTISCDLLSVDAMDTTGVQYLQIEHNIFQRRLDLNGKPIEDPQRTNITKTKAVVKPTDEETQISSTTKVCGDCYGAATETLECCNTCDDVQMAYRLKKWAMPDLAKIKQCQNDKSADKYKHAFTQGCQIYGYMEVNRVGGSFHIAPGDSYSVNHVHVHDVQPYNSNHFNMTHKIRHLSFGLNIPGKTNPMDDTTTVATEGAMMFYYYIKIVPTTYVRADGSTLLTNQFSVTRHSKRMPLYMSDSGMPGIFFSYELSPLMVKYTEKAKSFGHFATNTCAIIGGVFTVAGLIDSLLYHSVRAIQKKIELGKYN
ncbi:endoplasmic reticulum-Golgi intermediate compartment protein 3 isoform X2 [Harpegnathos saltator]|nr:endoplasmic reticulum-Golgi intermediate compartment protein 3 isoform X2 [Harpegnathos saltator]XP_025160501.1 endoplasmic reticulum-Golgi intermediate compartment protein 3 isoform X2 [Harpegnathos saltator]XP_025161139.1 endoplasmic reticulum-Golgi intermediate compartment protein 3 isoform X2 [Harpegnathos saltator]